MRCPFCDYEDTKVIDSRPADGKKRRRRECSNCGKRFTTYESVEMPLLMVLKRDGTFEPFDRTKLDKGIERALEKRPVSTAMVEQIANDIEDLAIIKGKETREISTSDLGELVLEKLYTIDKVSYIRFASVYRNFENLEEFIEEVKKIEKRGNQK